MKEKRPKVRSWGRDPFVKVDRFVTDGDVRNVETGEFESTEYTTPFCLSSDVLTLEAYVALLEKECEEALTALKQVSNIALPVATHDSRDDLKQRLRKVFKIVWEVLSKGDE